VRAAVLRAYNTPLEVEEVVLDAPGPEEVRVRTVAAGVCHSDLHVIEGTLPAPLPTVLGHEPAGVVIETGCEVTRVAPGDHVIGCVSAFCGACRYCVSGRPHLCGGASTARPAGAPPRLAAAGEPLQQFAHLSAFAEEMLVHERALVRIRRDLPLEQAALIGCGVTTGLGAVLNTARLQPGASAAVIGCGGVGLAAIQGCRIAGAGRIFAVDTVPWKLELARELGATDGVDASRGDAVGPVLEQSGGGVDYAFECIGTKATVRQAVAMIGRGATCVLVGVVPIGVDIELPGLDVVVQEKRILGSMMGSNRFWLDMPRYVDFALDGRLRLGEMISARLSLDEIPVAFERMKAGQAARSVVTFAT
jgi:S-(hydroxymethyl)glutathione dehydrogenase / alcohol dehydrogenase